MVILAGGWAASFGQDPKQIVQQAVQTELAADDADHSRWIYFDIDRKPNFAVRQWIAETSAGDLKRVLEENGRKLSVDEQAARINGFMRNSAAQTKQRKDDKSDDQQTRQMLNLLPRAFVWTQRGTQNGRIMLHFKPDPNFRPASYQARVFAAMEGDMEVDDAQHRITSLKGRLIHDVKFGGGLFGYLRAGGSFDVERRETGDKVWQIVETHVHIAGRILFFKSISEQEDDQKSKFKELPSGLSLAESERALFQQQGD